MPVAPGHCTVACPHPGPLTPRLPHTGLGIHILGQTRRELPRHPKDFLPRGILCQPVICDETGFSHATGKHTLLRQWIRLVAGSAGTTPLPEFVPAEAVPVGAVKAWGLASRRYGEPAPCSCTALSWGKLHRRCSRGCIPGPPSPVISVAPDTGHGITRHHEGR